MPDRLGLLQPIPANRTYESVLHHYEIEQEIARRLKAADRAGRKQIYSTMYDELFAQVPDHPRLTRRADPGLTEDMNRRKLKLVRRFIRRDGSFLEFGSGDCAFALQMTGIAGEVLAVDIADQIDPAVTRPENFRLVLYDGYNLDLPENSIDTVFSDQLIEHLHPEDTEHHFRSVHRVLKPGGVYAFRTPQRLTGPHDVSCYFSAEAEGFHLKEWTYGELAELVESIGYRSVEAYFPGRNRVFRVPMTAARLAEAVLRRVPSRSRLLRAIVPGISMAAYK